MTDLLVPETPTPLRPPVGLLLSIGEIRTNARGTEYPAKLDHFRAKPGRAGQYEREMLAFTEHYGDPGPKTLDDVKFISNDVPSTLDIRLLSFSKTGFRGRGLTNYADTPFLSREQFRDRTWSYVDTFDYYPRDSREVRPELRESWEGEPIRDELAGREDPRIDKLGIKVVATLEFAMPEIMGVGRVARISTSSRRSIMNLYSGLWAQWWFWGERLVGIPFRIDVRPFAGQRFVKNEEIKDDGAQARLKLKPGETFTGMLPFEAYELVLDTPLTEAEIFRRLAARRRELGTPTKEEMQRESEVLTQALALPPPREVENLRDEPEPDRPSDALLNRLARMEEEAGAGALMTLRGVFGAESAADLSAEDAERYERMLIDALPAEEVSDADVEVEDDEHEVSGAGEDGDAEGKAAPPRAFPAPEETPEPDPEADDGDVIVPGSLRMSGKRLSELPLQSLEWALARRPDLWDEGFREVLVRYCETRGIS